MSRVSCAGKMLLSFRWDSVCCGMLWFLDDGFAVTIWEYLWVILGLQLPMAFVLNILERVETQDQQQLLRSNTFRLV